MASKTAVIKAVVLGDVDDFKRGMKEVGESAEGAGDKVRRDLGDSFDTLGEGAGGAEQKFIGLSDSIGGTQDVMEGLRTGNVQVLAMGLADLSGAVEALWSSVGKAITQLWAKVTATAADTASTTANTGATIGQRIATTASTIATKAAAAAQWLLNAAMSANPIMLVVIALAALVAGFIIAYKNSETFRNIIDAIGRFFADTLWPILQNVAGWLGTVFVAMFDAARAAIGWVVDKAREFWDLLETYLFPVLTTLADWIGTYFVAQFKVAQFAIGLVVDIFRGAWDIVANYVWPILKTVGGWIGSTFVAQFNTAKSGVQVLIDVFQWLYDKAFFVYSGIVGVVNGIVDTIWGLGSRIWDATTGMFDGIKEAFRSAINWIIEKWNGLSFGIPGFDPPGPGPKFGGITIGTPNISYLAQGGIVKGGRGGTLAMIGEGPNDEIVAPLPRGGALGNTYQITINVAPGANLREAGRQMTAAIREYERAAG